MQVSSEGDSNQSFCTQAFDQNLQFSKLSWVSTKNGFRSWRCLHWVHRVEDLQRAQREDLTNFRSKKRLSRNKNGILPKKANLTVTLTVHPRVLVRCSRSQCDTTSDFPKTQASNLKDSCTDSDTSRNEAALARTDGLYKTQLYNSIVFGGSHRLAHNQ